MPEQFITDPLATNHTVPDWRLGYLDDGNPVQIFREVTYDFLSNGVIAQGDLVSLVAPTTALTPPRVAQTGAASSDYLILGVALNATTGAGQKVGVVTRGFCHMNTGANTPAAGNVIIQDGTTAGLGKGLAIGSVTATTIVGTLHGVIVGAKGADNRAWVYWYGSPC